MGRLVRNDKRLTVTMMNDAFFLYSTLCIVVNPKRFTIMWGVSPQSLPVCGIHLDETTATEQRRQCAHHTLATGGEDRESHRANKVDGDY